jgi:hypothetical protein
MTNGPPGKDGPFEDRNSKVEQVVRTRSSIRSASPLADDELTLLWGEFIAAQKRAHETRNIADGITAGRRFRLFLDAVAYLDRRGPP